MLQQVATELKKIKQAFRYSSYDIGILPGMITNYAHLRYQGRSVETTRKIRNIDRTFGYSYKIKIALEITKKM
jgi:hypothetical protein